MTTDRRALVAVAHRAIYERLHELLRIAGIKSDRAIDRDTGLELGFRRNYDLVVSDLPMRGTSLRDFLAHLTGSTSLSPGTPIILYGLSPGVARFHGAGELTQCRTLSELLRAVALHLGLGDRVTRRLLVQLELEVESTAVRRAMQTENLSISGMLLRTQRLLPVSSIVPFVLDLPLDLDPVEGQVEIVRHTNPGVEGLVGMGVRFLELDSAGGDRLASFVSVSHGGERPSLLT